MSENNYVTASQKHSWGLRMCKHVLSTCEACLLTGDPKDNQTSLGLGIKSKAERYRTLKIRKIVDICR